MKKTSTDLPHFGNMLNSYVRNNRFKQTELAHNIGVRTETLNLFMKRQDIKLTYIWSLCLTLRYNFLSDLAAQLPSDLPCIPTPKDQRIAELEAQLRDANTERDGLQREVKVLQGVIAAAMTQGGSGTQGIG